MDVLQWIKEDHQFLRSKIGLIGTGASKITRKKSLSELTLEVDRHLFLESEFLYPEVSDLYTGAPQFISQSQKRHTQIRKALQDLNQTFEGATSSSKKSLDEQVSELSVLLEGHLSEEEALLMPKMRELIPTRDREDLGQVFLDLKEEQTIGKVSKPLNGMTARTIAPQEPLNGVDTHKKKPGKR